MSTKQFLQYQTTPITYQNKKCQLSTHYSQNVQLNSVHEDIKEYIY